MAVIPALVTFAPNTVAKSADVNSNFTAITTAFNATAVLTDTSKTITVTHTWNASQTFTTGIAVSGLASFASGATFSTRPTFSSGFTVTTGASVLSSGASYAVGTIAVSGIATFATNVTLATTLDVGAGGTFGNLVVSNTIAGASSTLISIVYSTGATYFQAGVGATTLVNISAQSTTGANINLGAVGAPGRVQLFGTGAVIAVTSAQVVGARKTGWTVPTGTLQRTGFTTTGATLLDVVQTVAALIVDLHSTSATLSASGHGLIGT